MSNQIVFEHPLNERIRTFLRLEHLFGRTGHFLPQQDTWATRATIDALLDIASITARADIKTEILKELDRYANTLGRIRQQPGVDMQTLGKVLDDLEQATSRVYRMDGQLGQKIRENEFLKSIMQRSSIPGGTCSFDLPQYHHWLRQPHAGRQRQLLDWMRELEPIGESIALLLSLIRGSNTPTAATAIKGFFQDSLDPQAPVQMVRVAIDAGLLVFPEISGHKHRFSIRFLESVDTERPSQTDRDVDFMITRCIM